MGCGAFKSPPPSNLAPGDSPPVPSNDVAVVNPVKYSPIRSGSNDAHAKSNLTSENIRAHLSALAEGGEDGSKVGEDETEPGNNTFISTNRHFGPLSPNAPSVATRGSMNVAPSPMGHRGNSKPSIDANRDVRAALQLAQFGAQQGTLIRRSNVSKHVEYYLASAEINTTISQLSHGDSDKQSLASTMRLHDDTADQSAPPRFSINLKFLRRAWQAFRMVDPDESGQVDYAMFLAVLNADDSPLSKKLFNALDEKMSGTINYRQMLVAFVDFSNSKMHTQNCKLCFDVVDVREHGFLTTEDVCQFLIWRNILNDVPYDDVEYEVNALVRQLHVPTDVAGGEGPITLRCEHFTKLLRLFPHMVLAEPCLEKRLDKRIYKDMKIDIRRVHFLADSVCRLMSFVPEPEDNTCQKLLAERR